MQKTATGTGLYSARGERKYLTARERDRFLSASDLLQDARARTLCRTLALTGCRISEALAATGASLVEEDRVIVLRTLKRRRGLIVYRHVPIPDDLVALLCDTHRPCCEPQDRLWPLSRSHAWQIVKSVMASVGITSGLHAMPKGLRHAYGLHAIRSGVPISMLQKWMGHSRLESTLVYTQAVGAEERALAELMW